MDLKIKYDEDAGGYVSDSKHASGGVDLYQVNRFLHLCPSGVCDIVYLELLHDLAKAHGWEVVYSGPSKH